MNSHATALQCCMQRKLLPCLIWKCYRFKLLYRLLKMFELKCNYISRFYIVRVIFDQIKTSGSVTDSSKPSTSMSNEITWFSKTHFKSGKLNQNETRFWFIGVFLSLMPWMAYVISKLDLNLSLHSGTFSIARNWCKINFWTLHVYIHVRCVFWFSRCEFVRFSRPHGKAAWNYKIWGVDFYPISGICMWCNHQTG